MKALKSFSLFDRLFFEEIAAALPRIPGLRELACNSTVDEKVFVHIGKLKRLEVLSFGQPDRVSDFAMTWISQLTNLTMLHLWDTGVTEPAADAFKRPGLHFEPGPFGREHD